MLGKILDEGSYAREDKHINIDNVINIDFIKEQRELHEVKKSRAIEEASVWQVKYYLFYLKQRGVGEIKGKIDYPLLKKSIFVELSDQRSVEKIEGIIDEITQISQKEEVPVFSELKICNNCAYHDLCFILTEEGDDN